MKSLLVTLALILVAGFAPPAHAATGTLYGTVFGIQFNPGSSYGILYLSPAPNQGGTGSCQQPPAAEKMFKIPFDSNGDKERQILMSALLSGKSVQVNWNDGIKDGSGYCIIQGLLIWQTAP